MRPSDFETFFIDYYTSDHSGGSLAITARSKKSALMQAKKFLKKIPGAIIGKVWVADPWNDMRPKEA
jgi:hypothetical protein